MNTPSGLYSKRIMFSQASLIMTKEEYIRRYGEERYKQHLEMMKKRRPRKDPKLKKYYQSVKRDYITVKTYLPIPESEDYLFQLEEIDRLLGKLQRVMRLAWKEETTERFILTCDGGVISNKRGKFMVKVNLAQIGMDLEMRNRFKKEE